ncbi:SAF domain-containing protein [Cohnella zeiphila]|uniref:SAF domain-containing protein n=1 Tax=Cohnella zeiphila TaxID=2761120 RepID=A0A7X0VW45_9BACL|nr:SAF domain-containing protein [Cohnella zeiphila]MBB6732789.1 SAF domain-containing protein [Cohnella zeiphila]
MYRYRKWMVLTAVGVGFILLLLALIYYMHRQTQQKEQLRDQIEESSRTIQTMEQAKTDVLVLARDVQSGTTLQAGDVKIAAFPSDQISSQTLREPKEAIGKMVKIDLPQNLPLSASMLAEDKLLTDDLRVQEFNVIQLPTHLQKGQYVDVRINFPTGEDFIVLSKKKVQNVAGTVVWYEMNESEILNASSAIIDAYLQGAKLYALPYVEPGMQQAAIANYPANPKVLDLMARDPNILEKAKTELARQLRITLDQHLTAKSEADKIKVTGGNVALQQQLQNERVTTEHNNQFRQDLGSQAAAGNGSEPSEAQAQTPASSGDPTTPPVAESPTSSASVTDSQTANDRLQDVFDQSGK